MTITEYGKLTDGERAAYWEGKAGALSVQVDKQHEIIKELATHRVAPGDSHFYQLILNRLNIMGQALENLKVAESSVEEVLGTVIDHQLSEIADLKKQVADGTITEQSVQDVADKLNAFKDKVTAEVNPAPPADGGTGSGTGTGDGGTPTPTTGG